MKPKADYLGRWYISQRLHRYFGAGLSKAALIRKVKADLLSVLAPGQEGYWEVFTPGGDIGYSLVKNGWMKGK